MASITVALTLTAPLAHVLTSAMSVPLKAHVPLSCTTAVLVTVFAGLALSVNTTLTVWPGSAVVVPEITTSLLSTALMRLSPSSVASMVRAGGLPMIKMSALKALAPPRLAGPALTVSPLSNALVPVRPLLSTKTALSVVGKPV